MSHYVSEPTPPAILLRALEQAENSGGQALVSNENVSQQIEYVCRNVQNRAGVRLLLACLLAKIANSAVDIRKPYTEIGDSDSFSGRTYDEQYVGPFVTEHQLPANPTTAFLTPAFRNRNIVLTTEVNLVGRPPQLYQTLLELLDAVYQGRELPDDVLAETIRWLLIIRDEKAQRITSLLAALRSSEHGIPLATETIVNLVQQHLTLPLSSRLPVLVVAAAYRAASDRLLEQARPLHSHNAADEQTKSLGDVEIVLLNDDKVVTSYEMKTRRVSREDIDRAVQKIAQVGSSADNYIFITTEPVEVVVQDYAASQYVTTNGVEIVILDCIGFLRHFLHLFHRLRTHFVDEYQRLVLAEPESAVGHALKEAWLALRQAAESGLAGIDQAQDAFD